MKYELIKWGKDSYRIKALKDFDSVKKGEIGGIVQSKNNLSQKDNSWIAYDSSVLDNAKISGKVKILGKSKIIGNTKIEGQELICIKDSIVKNSTIVNRFSGNRKDKPEISILKSVIINGLVDGTNIDIISSKIKNNTIVASNTLIKDSCLMNNVLVENNIIENNPMKQKIISYSEIMNNSVISSDITTSICKNNAYIAYPLKDSEYMLFIINDMIITYFTEHKAFFINYEKIEENKKLYGKYSLKELKSKLREDKIEVKKEFDNIFKEIKKKYGFFKSLLIPHL